MGHSTIQLNVFFLKFIPNWLLIWRETQYILSIMWVKTVTVETLTCESLKIFARK